MGDGCAIFAGGKFSFKANVESFASSVDELDADRARWWILYAASQWKESTGAGLHIAYDGDYTTHKNTCPKIGNGTSEIAMTDDCHDWDDLCAAIAKTDGIINPQETSKTEADICIRSDYKYRVATAHAVDQRDLVSVLTHEFGHVFGFAHTPQGQQSIMTSGLDPFSTLRRYPFGDDIESIRKLYPPDPAMRVHWAAFDPEKEQWSAPVAGPGWTRRHPTAVIGEDDEGLPKIVVGVVGTDQALYWNRATWPLTPDSKWDGWSSWGPDFKSWHPPSIAIDHVQAGRWVMAWAKPLQTAGCSGINIAQSEKAFKEGWLIELPDACTAHQPTIAYDSSSKYFVLMWVSGGEAGSKVGGMINYKISENGIKWSPTGILGMLPIKGAKARYAIDAVDISCTHSFSDVKGCLVSYADGGADPWVVVEHVTVSMYGVNVHSRMTNFNRIARTPPIGIYIHLDENSGYQHNLLGLHWTSSWTGLADSQAHLWATAQGAVPPSGLAYKQVTPAPTEHTGAIASSPWLKTPFFMWVQR